MVTLERTIVNIRQDQITQEKTNQELKNKVKGLKDKLEIAEGENVGLRS